MRDLIKKIPLLRSVAKASYFFLIAPFKTFPGSGAYWRHRYKSGGISGSGSYNKFAEFKADVLNGFVQDRNIQTIIEYGCGDGNQLKLSRYPSYTGFDVSPDAISTCENIFSRDKTKAFRLIDLYQNETAELTLSLDVIYHLVENDIFATYMERLFDSSTRYVMIYSSNIDKQSRFQGAHVKHRMFTEWIAQNKPKWKLTRHIPNKYPYAFEEYGGIVADFYLYEKTYPRIMTA